MEYPQLKSNFEKIIIYDSKIKSIGSKANEFKKNNMIILFGEIVPDELKLYCYIIEIAKVLKKIKINDLLLVGNIEYIIIGVGNKVNRNLQEIGHITIDFNGNMIGQAGTLYVEKKDFLNVNVGSSIQIFRKANIM